jgi:type VI secretion system protein ImpA
MDAWSKEGVQKSELAKAARAFTMNSRSVAVFMIDVEELLNPISAENPCGEDISYEPKFLALDALVGGKPETFSSVSTDGRPQFSAAEEPDWRAVRDACLEGFGRSKNLRVAVTLALALMNLEGASGLRGGLILLKGLLERYWLDFYPKLDPEENNDPLERINILSSLSTPLGTFGDPIRFLQRLRQIPLTNSPQMGRLTFAHVAGDKTILPEGEEKSPVSAAQIKAAFRDTSTEELAETAQAISDSIALAKSIDSYLTNTVGPGRAPDMGALLALLQEIEKCLAPYLPAPSGQGANETQAETSRDSTGEGPSESAAIRSRQDVVRALERICQYYARNEPSSPLPFLLRRAQRLVEMDFLQIIDELTPEARAHLDTIVGAKIGSDRAASEKS